ncbi:MULTISPECIES: antiterminator Q family protein [Proteus]|uniref:antiterminator Q family protein n=1 Tax=Proteus TaxID=583 RepID=UPI0006674CA4|nr:antiterminator Q family protein [Proteus mirabilis]EHZ8014333.1 antitermination protein [Proteus mirabilis]EKV2709470.1 antitermination protein [Proteus mirabilis]EKX5073835.1 antitermination protein [Proteus mirabilis]ELA7801136.1 antitermination protein [Proteus mirabilis]ELA9902137.1 antitermination protein [Proteus mirabilis]
MRDMQEVLSRWGAWSANEGNSVDYSSIAAGFKGLVPSSRRSRDECSDSDGLKINKAVLHLRKSNSYLFQLVIMYYVKNYPLRSMATRLGISHNEVAKRLQTAEGFIDGCLSVSNVKLDMDKIIQKDHIYMLA